MDLRLFVDEKTNPIETTEVRKQETEYRRKNAKRSQSKKARFFQEKGKTYLDLSADM